MTKIIKYKYIFRCKNCSQNLITPIIHCKKCNAARPAFFIMKENNEKPKCLCLKCNTISPISYFTKTCINCGSKETEWWDTEQNIWMFKEVTLNNKKQAIWLTGEFQGDFIGSLIDQNLPKNTSLLNNYQRNYDFKITSGILSNYEASNTAPSLKFHTESSPIKQENIESILIKANDSDELITIKVTDVLIYDWHEKAAKEFLEQKKMSGHILGKICCTIVEKSLDDLTLEKSINQTSAIKDSKVEKNIPINSTSQNEITHKTSQNEITHETECLICNAFLQFCFAILAFFIIQTSNSKTPIWGDLFCNLIQAFVFLISLKLLCFLIKYNEQKWIYFKNIKINNLFENALIGFSILSLLMFYSNNKLINCFEISWLLVWPLINFITLMLSSLTKSCIKKFILALLFSLSIMLSINCDKQVCEPNQPKQQASFKNQINNITNKMNVIVEENKANEVEDMVKELTENDKLNQKVTLDDLRDNNQMLDNCESSLYLNQLSLFDRNSSVIKETAKDKLIEVASLINGQSNTKNYIITGHADQTGELNPDGSPNPIGYANNIRLSKERALAVGNWLVSNNLIEQERLMIRGVGSSEPLTTSLNNEEQKVNIRVEISLNCINE